MKPPRPSRGHRMSKREPVTDDEILDLVRQLHAAATVEGAHGDDQTEPECRAATRQVASLKRRIKEALARRPPAPSARVRKGLLEVVMLVEGDLSVDEARYPDDAPVWHALTWLESVRLARSPSPPAIDEAAASTRKDEP